MYLTGNGNRAETDIYGSDTVIIGGINANNSDTEGFKMAWWLAGLAAYGVTALGFYVALVATSTPEPEESREAFRYTELRKAA